MRSLGFALTLTLIFGLHPTNSAVAEPTLHVFDALNLRQSECAVFCSFDLSSLAGDAAVKQAALVAGMQPAAPGRELAIAGYYREANGEPVLSSPETVIMVPLYGDDGEGMLLQVDITELVAWLRGYGQGFEQGPFLCPSEAMSDSDLPSGSDTGPLLPIGAPSIHLLEN